MNAQQQAKASEGRSSTRDNAATPFGANAALADLWTEKLKTWTTAMSAFGAAAAMPMDAYASLVRDVEEAAKSTSEQVQENMQVLRDGLQELGKSSGPAAYFKASTALQEKLAQQGAATSQRMMALAGAFASRRMRANADLASTLIEKAKSRPSWVKAAADVPILT